MFRCTSIFRGYVTFYRFVQFLLILHDLARGQCMNPKENMHEVRLPNIYILSHTMYYNVPLTIVSVLAIKAVDFPKVRQTLSTKFAMHYGDIKD